MHSLTRQVRFSINPFLSETHEGYNSYASRPCGNGLGIYFSFWVDLASELDPDTGFVVNVSNIDQVVRCSVVPLFSDAIYEAFRIRRPPTFISLVAILEKSWAVIADAFRSNAVVQLRLELNPYKQISIRTSEANMFIYSEKFGR